MLELSVPPTPPVPLAALLAREDLGLRQIAGPSGPGIVIHWAHTSEMADPYPYLLGGELLLTAGVHIPEAAGSDGGASHRADPRPGGYFDDYVARIVAAGGTALGFGLAPVHDTVPRALVAACEAYELPLLEVPPRTTFSGVARAVWQLMAEARLAELRRVTEAQQSLAAAASRPHPVPSVLRRLAQRLGGWAVLYGPDGTGIADAGRRPAAETRRALTLLTDVVRPPHGTQTASGSPPPGDRVPRPADAPPRTSGAPATGSGLPTPSSATDTLEAAHLAAYALGAGQGFVLGVAVPRREAGDHTIASVAAVLLSLLTGEHQSGAGAARSSALVRLLLGAPPEDVAALLGPDRWVVVHARPEGQAPDAVAASALGAALGSALVDLARDVVRILVPADREPAPQPGWTLGVSAAVAPHDWPAADTQAARALARAHATRTTLVRHCSRPRLAQLVAPEEAEGYARTVLAPLAPHPALAETLRTWLSLHGSWDRTAVALAVHRNTVRQRIARCGTLLGTDLDDPDVRMELWFALKQM
ncbi:PucR family transcriptional regulator [Streptomyces brasiliensis]|uniref:PucR family transcriptional regulator n=1 Tax=Streptomyces brasiliensis TaxID=1954 RepID=A0A917KM50_9ACTN|nr:PucR family transcriptional regulator [Streptomyces brasiliensis]GGJ17140.1 PucR family transcriptional regulator [Streptomyces brasiliensis]